MSEDELWLASEAEPDGPFHVGRSVFVWADTPELAAARAMTVFWEDELEDSATPAPPRTIFLLEASGAHRYRAILGAEAVPDEFQCCGGMPALALGSLDEHTVPCKTHREAAAS